MKLKSALCALGTIGCLLSFGNTALAEESPLNITQKELTCTDPSPYHNHSDYYCYTEKTILTGSAELNPWDIKATADGNIEVPITIKIDPDKQDLNSSNQPIVKNVLFKYILSEKTAYENGKLVTDPTHKAMYDAIYKKIMVYGSFDLRLPPVEESIPQYDGYGDIKYYFLTYSADSCDVGRSRRDNVIYLDQYSERGELYYPRINEYSDAYKTTKCISYRIMKDNASVWKKQEYDEYSNKPENNALWEVCDDQVAIEQLAQGLGITGKGR